MLQGIRTLPSICALIHNGSTTCSASLWRPVGLAFQPLLSATLNHPSDSRHLRRGTRTANG